MWIVGNCIMKVLGEYPQVMSVHWHSCLSLLSSHDNYWLLFQFHDIRIILFGSARLDEVRFSDEQISTRVSQNWINDITSRLQCQESLVSCIINRSSFSLQHQFPGNQRTVTKPISQHHPAHPMDKFWHSRFGGGLGQLAHWLPGWMSMGNTMRESMVPRGFLRQLLGWSVRERLGWQSRVQRVAGLVHGFPCGRKLTLNDTIPGVRAPGKMVSPRRLTWVINN